MWLGPAREILDVLRDQLPNRTDSITPASISNLHDWCNQMELDFEGFEAMELEDQEFLLDEAYHGLMDHKGQLEVCRESVEELVYPEADDA